MPKKALGWNPNGNAYFQMSGCTVQSVIDESTGDGSTYTLVGQGVRLTDNGGDGGVPAKIRDEGWIPKLIEVFSYPLEDPRYMPVVRDLSEAKQKTIVTWLNNGALD